MLRSPVKRYDEYSMLAVLNSYDAVKWTAVKSAIWKHVTPAGIEQYFRICWPGELVRSRQLDVFDPKRMKTSPKILVRRYTYLTLGFRYLIVFLMVLGVANQEVHGCAFNCKKQDVESAAEQSDLVIQNGAKHHIPRDLNKTTSRFIRNNYMCQVGDNPSLRPPEAVT